MLQVLVCSVGKKKKKQKSEVKKNRFGLGNTNAQVTTRMKASQGACGAPILRLLLLVAALVVLTVRGTLNRGYTLDLDAEPRLVCTFFPLHFPSLSSSTQCISLTAHLTNTNRDGKRLYEMCWRAPSGTRRTGALRARSTRRTAPSAALPHAAPSSRISSAPTFLTSFRSLCLLLLSFPIPLL